MHLLVYANPEEPVTRVLLKNQKALGLRSLWLRDLLEKGEIFDEFDKDTTSIQWFLPDIGTITNSQKTVVINRATHLPEEWFQQFHYKDRLYGSSEFWAYLTFALNSFPNITERPNIGSMSGGCFPLTEQWKIINCEFPELSTPEYYIGPLDFLPEPIAEKPIFSHPYNFYYWKVSEVPTEQKESLFAIRKPDGFPIIAFVIGDHVETYQQDEQTIPEMLPLIAKKIHSHFQFFSSEILFFLNDDQLFFCMIHNCPIGPANSQNFEEIVLKEIKAYLT